MRTAKKPVKQRPVLISGLAAKLLGHSRISGQTDFTAHHMAWTFPAFNAMELANAINELVDKRLVKQKGAENRATYSLTDHGREGRVGVS